MSESKLTLIEGEKPKCPSCGSYDYEPSYGLAFGGIGSYNICHDCPALFGFVPDEED